MNPFPHGYTSYSQIDSFLRCPWYFYLRYVLRIREPSNHYAAFGSAVHAVLEQDNICQQQYGKHHDLLTLVDIYNRYWEEHEMYFTSDEQEHEYRELGLQMIADYIKRPVQKIVGVEHEFLAYVPSFGTPIKGFIDKIYEDDSGLVVVDFKTGKPYPKWKVDTSLQIAIYGIALKQLCGEYPARYEFHFTRNDLVMPTYRSESEIIKAGLAIQNTIQKMKRAEFLQKYDNDFWCNKFCGQGITTACYCWDKVFRHLMHKQHYK